MEQRELWVGLPQGGARARRPVTAAGSAGGSATGHLREHRGDANDALAQVGVVSGREKVDDGGDLADASERDAVVVAARIAGEPGAFGDGEDDTVGGAHELLAQVLALRRDRGRRSPLREVEGESVAVESFVSEEHVSLLRARSVSMSRARTPRRQPGPATSTPRTRRRRVARRPGPWSCPCSGNAHGNVHMAALLPAARERARSS